MAIETTCRSSGKSFEISDFELDFYRQIAPRFGSIQIELPHPTLAPLERRRRRLAFRNIRSLYRRTSDLSGDKLFSMYAPESPHKVYHTNEWVSDAWDALDYGRDYDFSRSFHAQFSELFLAVPLPHRFGIANENSEYINGASFCKDCYLSFNLFYCDRGLYLADATNTISSTDCLIVDRCELCYECAACEDCYNLSYSERCRSSSDSLFLFQCQQCRNCIGCWNLQGAENYILNEPASAAEVAALKKELSSAAGRERFKSKVAEQRKTAPRRSYVGFRNEDFSGDFIYSTKNAHNCFQCNAVEDCRHCVYVFNSDHCVDLDVYGDRSSWIYESTATGNNCSNVLFGNGCWAGSHHTLYCTFVMAAGHCLGCSGIQNREYCIFNKQYTKAQYEELAPRIIRHMQSTGEWGEFFNPTLSPFTYNETFAHELMPLTKEKAIALGYAWRDLEERAPASAAKLSYDRIEDVPENIVDTIFACDSCPKPFRVISAELSFYRQQEIPPPHNCPECRHAKRRALVSKFELSAQNCSQCQKQLESTYPANQGFPVYCDDCFRREIYG